MTETSRASQYALGSTDAEHERLMRQAARLAPSTERFFRDAGIGVGQRVLDIGSGVGDVAMLAARLVGPSGEVMGIERDMRSIARARARVAEAGLRNVSFMQSDVNQISGDKPFDAAVGRLILMYLPDPVAVLRSLYKLLCPGGILAFQEPSWASSLALNAHLPLWSACTSLIRETFQHSGVNTEVGLSLYGYSRKPGCLHQACVWKCHSEMIQNGSTASFAVCVRKWSSLTCRFRRWAVSIRFRTDFELRSWHRRRLPHGWPSSGLGLTSRWKKRPSNRHSRRPAQDAPSISTADLRTRATDSSGSGISF